MISAKEPTQDADRSDDSEIEKSENDWRRDSRDDHRARHPGAIDGPEAIRNHDTRQPQAHAKNRRDWPYKPVPPEEQPRQCQESAPDGEREASPLGPRQSS